MKQNKLTYKVFFIIRKVVGGIFKLINKKNRKEVIHPHLPVGIPCYDLVPIAEFSFIPQSGTSATLNFVGLTGGVCKTRERIHRDLLIRDYYRFRVHGVELQTSIPTEAKFQRFA